MQGVAIRSTVFIASGNTGAAVSFSTSETPKKIHNYPPAYYMG